MSNGWCDGSTVHDGGAAAAAHDGVLGSIDVAALRARFPAGTDFSGPIPTASPATGNGRPFFAPHAFTFKVVVTPTTGTPRTGEDQRTAWLHRDQDLLGAFPRTIGAGGSIGGPTATPTADGASSPAFADLDGDNRNDLVFADSDGFVHAIASDGSELPGWPVRGDEPGFVKSHDASPAYSDGVGTDLGGAFLSAVAVDDADGDGIPEVYAADVEGKVYGWAPDGTRVFTEQSNPAWSGKPLTPFVNVRNGKTNRTQHGFFGAPVIADLDGDGRDEVIAASMDRHVYAWSSDDSDPGAPGGAADAPGYPVLVVDPAKVAAVDPQTHAVTFSAGAGSLMQGAIVDTPAVGDVTGDGVPEVIVGTNEEYDETLNLGNPGGLGLLLGAGLVDPGNSRVFALKASGGGDSDPLPTDALVPGWPFDVGMLLTETLPIVGEGVAGPPVIGPVDCPSGGSGSKVGTATAAGPAYVINGDGTSCYGETSGQANALSPDFGGAAHATDTPLIPALGNPAFGAAGGTSATDPGFIMGAIGLFKALDLQVVDYQSGQDLLGVWDPASGQFRSGFPATVNDLQLLTGPAVGDVDGNGGEEVLTGSSSQDLVAYGPGGTPASGWPKLTTDWTVATPLIGSFGTEDTKASARKVVVGDHPLRLHPRLRDRCAGLLTVVLTSLPPRQRQLRRLLARRRPAGRPGGVEGGAGQAALRRPRGRPALRHRRPLRARDGEAEDRRVELRRRQAAAGGAAAEAARASCIRWRSRTGRRAGSRSAPSTSRATSAASPRSRRSRSRRSAAAATRSTAPGGRTGCTGPAVATRSPAGRATT